MQCAILTIFKKCNISVKTVFPFPSGKWNIFWDGERKPAKFEIWHVGKHCWHVEWHLLLKKKLDTPWYLHSIHSKTAFQIDTKISSLAQKCVICHARIQSQHNLL